MEPQVDEMVTIQGPAIYQYQPLAADEIRLIEVLPRGPIPTESIRCRLRNHRCTEDLEYDALSYPWGEPLFNIPIIIVPNTLEGEDEIKAEDAFLCITPTLYSALQRVQDRANGQTVMIWADAMCINQNDIPEKNAQVRLMRNIYEQASTTWIDLGDEMNGSELVPDIFERILEDYDILEAAAGGLEMTYGSLPPAGAPEWTAVNASLRRPW